MAGKQRVNPAQAIGIYYATPPTIADGDTGELRLNATGALVTTNDGSAPLGGGITWGAPTEVASDGASKTLVAAAATRKAIMIWNPVGNAQMSIDIAGGTVTLAKGLPLLSGDMVTLTGADCPVGAITFIGTNLQNLVYQQGT